MRKRISLGAILDRLLWPSHAKTTSKRLDFEGVLGMSSGCPLAVSWSHALEADFLWIFEGFSMDFEVKVIWKIDQKPFQQRYQKKDATSVGSTSRPQN